MEITKTYEAMAARLSAFASGLAFWEKLDQATQQRIGQVLETEAPRDAVRRYFDRLSSLCADYPEVRYWTSLHELTATRKALSIELRGVTAEVQRAASTQFRALGQLSTILDRLGPIPQAKQSWTELQRIYVHGVDQPFIDFGQFSNDLGPVAPRLSQAYVSPAFRVVPVAQDSRVSEDGWWQKVTDVRDDLDAFLAGYLTNPASTEVPLLVLGLPGAGKSVYTRMLAAQLTSGSYRAIRVDLRRVAGDATIEQRIEQAVLHETKRRHDWADLVEGLAGGVPVVILDGFDELLQTTASSNSDFLERVVRFQQSEAARGHPVVTIVTSRTAVAHRARTPAGTIALRLEPFDEERVHEWLAHWNGANERYFRERQLQPLQATTVGRHWHLAEQPLLLQMLAIYDADDNALQRERGQIGVAELYDRLFAAFVGREVSRADPVLDDGARAIQIERELHRLAIAAVGIFNRGAQYVTENELRTDLEALDPTSHLNTGEDHGRHGRLNAAQMLIGRFFFLHVSRAVDPLGGTSEGAHSTLRTYEFLHATFGEYLVARLAVHALQRSHGADDDELYTLLSFQPLTLSSRVIEFMTYLVRSNGLTTRADVLARLCETFTTCLRRTRWLPDRYAPLDMDAPTRLSTYGFNLLMLALVIQPAIAVGDLFRGSANPTDDWLRRTRLWYSTLTEAGWKSALDSIELQPRTSGDVVALRQRRPPAGVTHDQPDVSQLREFQRTGALVHGPLATSLMGSLGRLLDFDAMFLPSALGPPAILPLLNIVLRRARAGDAQVRKDYLDAWSASGALEPPMKSLYRAALLKQLALEPLSSEVRGELLRHINDRQHSPTDTDLTVEDVHLALRALDLLPGASYPAHSWPGDEGPGRRGDTARSGRIDHMPGGISGLVNAANQMTVRDELAAGAGWDTLHYRGGNAVIGVVEDPLPSGFQGDYFVALLHQMPDATLAAIPAELLQNLLSHQFTGGPAQRDLRQQVVQRWKRLRRVLHGDRPVLEGP
jgi:hypothetical protein